MLKQFALATMGAALLAGTASAGDVLWYLGHNGNDEGHADIQALLESEGAVFDAISTNPLPALDSYNLVFIVLPGFFDGTDFFDADEKARLNTWLAVGSHRVVMVGEWDGFYQGQAVMEDLLAAIGNPIIYVPGAYDTGCGHCSGPLGVADPLTDGLDHVCYAFTATWVEGIGASLAYPEDASAPGPYIVSNGTDIPCIVGLGDSNITTDLCHPTGWDADTMEFHRRLYNITCAGEAQWACCFSDGSCTLLTEGDCGSAGGTFYDGQTCATVDCVVVPTEETSWGSIKHQYK